MNSQDLKIATLNWLLFRRNFLGAFTESYNQADVLGVTRSFYSHEFEVKISKEDLVKELKAVRFLIGADTNMRRARAANKLIKHKTYLETWKPPSLDNPVPAIVNPYFIPNYFSFVVPPAIVEFTQRSVEGTPYGVFYVDHEICYSVVTPQKIHGFKIKEDQLFPLLRKASTENLNLREALRNSKVSSSG